MSDNNLVNIKGMSDEQIMQAIGQDDGSNLGNNIPRLAINRTPEDDDGNQLPVGHFYTYDSKIGQNVFGKPVTLRPFISAMQYMHYDADKGEYVNRSIIFKSWKEEAIDILGGTKCGKIPFKERSSLTPEQLAEVKKAELQFEAQMKELDVDIFALETADKQDARKAFGRDSSIDFSLNASTKRSLLTRLDCVSLCL